MGQGLAWGSMTTTLTAAPAPVGGCKLPCREAGVGDGVGQALAPALQQQGLQLLVLGDLEL